ncbi:hypothetical protein PBV87_09935 [Niameybacter massiliensis]|uniref:Uncharacterized protein n=1 Tax=Holtiella tumoricola TaxID=3018743 RepID=A0AA42DMZ3_9FIRM|nr:hypothetical protein [Holtiella tumoricola]MDA3731796.1 hypothetical protein [Holtiella tumoricola]
MHIHIISNIECIILKEKLEQIMDDASDTEHENNKTLKLNKFQNIEAWLTSN